VVADLMSGVTREHKAKLVGRDQLIVTTKSYPSVMVKVLYKRLVTCVPN
jgi:hypothetical protein